jgi:hypothetical protein
MNHRFAEGDLVRNKTTKEDGKVVKLFENLGTAMYTVNVPLNRFGWETGAVIAFWPDMELNATQNEFLK